MSTTDSKCCQCGSGNRVEFTKTDKSLPAIPLCFYCADAEFDVTREPELVVDFLP